MKRLSAKGRPCQNMKKKIGLALGIIIIAGLAFTARLALAADFGFDPIANTIGLSQADPRFIVGRIIQIALSLLGLVALVIILAAGTIWMTSGGDEEKISRAKRLLKNAVIGLVIILSAWAIATFVINRLYQATGGGGGNFGGGGGLEDPGLAAAGACTVDSFYPANGQTDVPRNTSIMISFKEAILPESACVDGQGDPCACGQPGCSLINPAAIKVYKTDLGDGCPDATCPETNTNVTDIAVSMPSGNQTLVLTPLSFLGSPSDSIQYSVKFSSQLKKVDGVSMFANCSSDYFSWSFLVNTSLDLTPPQVLDGGIFPVPDDDGDVYQQLTPAQAAQGEIAANSCPNIYAPAELISVLPSGPAVSLDYHGQLNSFIISVPADYPNKAQLFDGQDGQTLLGVADFDGSGLAVFPNYLSFQSENHPAGSLWTVSINPEQAADTLAVGNESYIFADSFANNKILVPSPCTPGAQAANIAAKLSGHEQVSAALVGSTVELTAKVAGEAGNDIILSTSNNTALTLQPMSGGTDLEETTLIQDEKDRPMNSVIQVNFNEAINPITVSGPAETVSPYIRVLNADKTAGANGAVCSQDADCLSYKCQSGACVGDFLPGKFVVSNGYKTLEFISDQECGLNGCGEKIYCLPADSHLSVELVSADLKPCDTDADCLAYNPFKSCATSPLPYRTCQDLNAINYPTANLSLLTGLIDAAANSLDGNRDTAADGPIDFYDDNKSKDENINKKDKYTWSFFINDKIATDPPQISFVSPQQAQSGQGLAVPIQINFNTLMMNSSLRTGSLTVQSGTSSVIHKLINLRSAAPSPLGYWILNENKDVNPLDGEPDTTISKIFHSTFQESVTYKPQVGSGVKDIYQNCYKPSAGPGCSVTPSLPSCCFGVPSAVLGPDGNCQ